MADRPRTASSTDEDNPHRLTAHVNLCKAAQEAQKPRASSGAGPGKEGTVDEDIATPRAGLDNKMPHKEIVDPRYVLTPETERHKNSHNQYSRKPSHNKAQYKKTKTIL
jgi:hypothetical protein